MTIFICISLYVREMFCFKQISSHFTIADVCFFRRRGRGFSAHANDTIILWLLTLTNLAPLAPLPTHPFPTGIAFSLGSLGVSLAHAGMHRPMTALEQQ